MLRDFSFQRGNWTVCHTHSSCVHLFGFFPFLFFPPTPLLFFFQGRKVNHLVKNIFLRDHLRYLAIAKYRKRERRKMQGWGIKENFQPVLKAWGTASGTPPLSSPQKFTQPFKLADPRDAEWGWPRPLLANQEPSRIPPTQNKPAAPITAPPTPAQALVCSHFFPTCQNLISCF